MRAALLTSWPSLSHMFHLHPWDVDRLSAAEVRVYLDALADIEFERKKNRG